MCWSSQVSVAMTGIGTAAAVISYHRNDPAAIWLTLGYFSAMEALQVAGYGVVDQCGALLHKSAEGIHCMNPA